MGSATDGANGFDTLSRASRVDTFVIGGSTYAIVTGYGDHGVQLIDVSDPSNPTAAGSASDGVDGFEQLERYSVRDLLQLFVRLFWFFSWSFLSTTGHLQTQAVGALQRDVQTQSLALLLRIF